MIAAILQQEIKIFASGLECSGPLAHFEGGMNLPELKLVIAEKPSVGMELARVLGCHGRRKGYMIGSGYIVSWCVGHLAGLAVCSVEGQPIFRRQKEGP